MPSPEALNAARESLKNAQDTLQALQVEIQQLRAGGLNDAATKMEARKRELETQIQTLRRGFRL